MCIFFRFIWIAFFFSSFIQVRFDPPYFWDVLAIFYAILLFCFAIYNFFSFSQDSSELLSLPGFLLFWVLFCSWAPPVNFSIALFQADGIWRKTAASTWWSERDLVYLPLLSAFKSNGMINERRCPCSRLLRNATCESLLLVFFQFNLFLIYFNSYVGYFFLT